MKKFTMLFFVLALVLSLGSVIMAEEAPEFETEGWPRYINTQEICVKAKNPLYGEITGLPCTPPCVDIGRFTGKENSTVGKDFSFSIKSNGFLKVGLRLDQPFTHMTPGWNDKLATQVVVSQGNARRLGVHHDWAFYPTLPSTYTMVDNPLGHPSGRGVRDYTLNIKGKLADIHEQAQGDYKAVVTITLAAP